MRENLHGTVDTLLPHRMFTFPSPSFPEFFVLLSLPFVSLSRSFFLFFHFFFFNRSLGEAKNARYFFFLTNIHRKSG